MKLFYFVADSYPAWRFDLVELFGRELKSLGMSVTWVMRRDSSGLCSTREQEGQTVLLPFSLGRSSVIDRLANRPLEAICEVYWFLRLIFGPRYDVIQVRDDRYLAAFWAWIAARLTGAKFTYWISFPFPENDAEKSKRATGLRRTFLALRARITGWWLYDFILHRADHIFVQSDEMKRDVQAHGLPQERLTPVPMGVPIRLLSENKSRARTINPNLIVYIGTLDASRRLTMMIEAFSLIHQQVQSARLIVIGDGVAASDRRELEDLSRDHNLTDIVEFTGFLPVADVWRITAQAAIGLSPIYPDTVFRVGSPTKIVEYMAMAIPVVCNDHPEQSLIIEESNAGLCVEWSAVAFAEAVLDLLAHPEESVSMGKRGPAWVEAHRTYPVIAHQVWKKYQEIRGITE